MMPFALPKQNSCQKRMVQLDARRVKGELPLPSFFALAQSNSCDEFPEPGAKPLATAKAMVISY
jgi:hypothetical protein